MNNEEFERVIIKIEMLPFSRWSQRNLSSIIVIRSLSVFFVFLFLFPPSLSLTMLDWFFSLFFSVSLSSTPAQIFRSHKKYSFLKFDPYFRIIRTRFCCCDIHITRNSNKVLSLSLSYIILWIAFCNGNEMVFDYSCCHEKTLLAQTFYIFYLDTENSKRWTSHFHIHLSFYYWI